MVESHRFLYLQRNSTRCSKFVLQLSALTRNVVRPPKREERNPGISDSDESDHGDEEMPAASRGRGRGARGGRGSRGGRGQTSSTSPRATTSRARGTARGSQSTSRASSVSIISFNSFPKT